MTAAVTTGVCPRCNLPIPVAVHQCARVETEVYPPRESWTVEAWDSLASEWMPVLGRRDTRAEAEDAKNRRQDRHPGVTHRLVCERTTYTIEDA